MFVKFVCKNIFQGEWQCEVGGIIQDAFETDTATISVEVKSKFFTKLIRFINESIV
jgi:hypothetical protein